MKISTDYTTEKPGILFDGSGTLLLTRSHYGLDFRGYDVEDRTPLAFANFTIYSATQPNRLVRFFSLLPSVWSFTK